MNNLKKLHYLGCLVLALPLAGQAQPQSAAEEELTELYGSEEFVRIATGVAQPVSKAPAVATVITADDIKKMGATDIDEALETVPGLHVARSPIGYNPIYVFRGISSDFNPQVLMLVNGIPLTNLYTGDRNQVWGGMPVEAISRIEVVRGPGSAVYGADAFAGVINIITKTPAEMNGLAMGARAGSFDSQAGWLQYGKSQGDWRVGAVVEARTFDGQRERINADAQSFLDQISGTQASLAPGRPNLGGETMDARFELGYRYITFRTGAQLRRDGGLGVGIAQALDSHAEAGSNRFNTDLTYDNPQLTDTLGLKVQGSALFTTQEVERNFVLFPPGSRGPFFTPLGTPIFPPFPDGLIGNPEVFERHYRLNSVLSYSGFADHQLAFGAGYHYGEVYKTKETKNFGFDPTTGFPILPGSPLVDVSNTPLVFLPEGRRENTSVFVQDIWHFANDWELTAGARYDHFSDFGDTTNPRVALVWSARQNLTIKALYGEAFRAPSFAETRVQSNPAFLGNFSLKPESLESTELAFNYRPRFDVTLDFNLFQYTWQDIIQFIPDAGGGTRTAQNSGEQKGHGAEFAVAWEATKTLKLSGNLAWQKSEDQATHEDSGNAPGHQTYARADWVVSPGWNLGAQTNWVADRNRVVGDPRGKIDDYVMTDLTLRNTSLVPKLEFALLVKNLFDAHAREPSLNGDPVPMIPNDLPLAGRAAFVEVRYTP
ncbi:MAG: TonB-dependent receptor [Gammaproteobacteria bacterium]|nr:TonB-dependent receptor [Gammaproteobacteria bacterium]